ncbi:hypothetical protein D3Z36_10325 [Lachnospiraceae bacterium]|nr:hypothetical protein [Lachnospiraceae bacterium]
MTFNPNELILEKIRSVEEYDLATNALVGRYTQIESPSLKTAATGTAVTDAMGAEITTFYNAQTGTFDFTNSLFSLDLAASQFGATKEISSTNARPVSETITINNEHQAVLKYVPIGTEGAEITSVKVINDDNTFGASYELSTTTGAVPEGAFVLDAQAKTLHFPEDVTGRVFVRYDAVTGDTVKITKTSDSIPEVRSLLVHALFHDPCNTNLVYAGVISIPRAQIDPSAVELTLTSEGKHAASYKLQKSYCDENAKLFDIIVSNDSAA